MWHTVSVQQICAEGVIELNSQCNESQKRSSRDALNNVLTLPSNTRNLKTSIIAVKKTFQSQAFRSIPIEGPSQDFLRNCRCALLTFTQTVQQPIWGEIATCKNMVLDENMLFNDSFSNRRNDKRPDYKPHSGTITRPKEELRTTQTQVKADKEKIHRHRTETPRNTA